MRRALLVLALLLAPIAAEAQSSGQGVAPGSPPPSAGGSVSGPILEADGSAAAPSYSWINAPTVGMYREANLSGQAFAGGVGATAYYLSSTGSLNWLSGTLAAGTADLSLIRDGAADTLAQRRGTNTQEWRLGPSGAYLRFIKGNGTGSSTLRTVDSDTLDLGTSDTSRWRITAAGHLLAIADNTYDVGNGTGTLTRPRSVFPAAPAITVGSGTGISVGNAGEVRDLDYVVTIASTAFVCNAVTCDVTIGTLPAKTLLYPSQAEITTTFACASVCTTSTLSFVLGKGAGGAEYLASFDADAATGTFGDADAELGTLLTRAAAIAGGTYTIGSQAVVLRLTSGTGAVGNGSVTNLSQGSVTITLRHRVRG